MSSFPLLLAAVVALVALVWWYRRSRANDSFEGIIARRRKTAKISSRAELVDGRNHIPVALTLDQGCIYYENSDLDASLELDRLDEVEYASELLAGTASDGTVLRLRSHGRAVEFVLDLASAEKWSQLLPPHRIDEAGSVHAV
jgi:hypothetical protein